MSLDLATKHTIGFGYETSDGGIPTYDIVAEDWPSGESLDITTVAFPTLKGYEIIIFAGGGRYTHTLAFMKSKKL